MTRFLVVALSSTLVFSARANAQGMISGAKAVAGRAAVAANAHTTAEQNPNGTQAPATAAKTTPVPAASAKTTPAASAKTTPVASAKTTPVASAKTTPVASAPAAATSKVTPIAATTKPVAPATATAGKPATATTTAVKPGAAPTKATTGKLVPAVAPPVTTDTEARSISVTQRGIKGEVSLNREVFSYDAGGRRDPFVSLLRNGDLRPDVGDLCLMVVLYDPTGRNSVGIMRDVSTKDQYRVRVGVTLGRMRVAQIEPREVVFTIEEIGFSRQEVLPLGCSSTARKQ